MKRTLLLLCATSAFTLLACSSKEGSGFGDAGGGGDGGPSTVPTGEGGSMGPLGGSGADGSGPGTGVATPCSFAATDPVDHDGDGWSGADGDCNDCNKFINPGAYDIPGNGIDEDCNGKADDEPTGCDGMVGVSTPATTLGGEGATAMDLCRTTTSAPPLPSKTWGVVSADYVLPDGSSASGGQTSNFMLGLGLLGPTFGQSNKTQEGVRMLGLSSGTARRPSDPGYQDVSGFDKGYTSGAPSGFPGQTPACGSVMFGAPHDGAGLRVVVRVPTNAATMSFDTNFFSYEFPDWICSEFNDTFVVIMSPPPAGEPASANHNIAFDSQGNVISVNAGFLTVCNPNTNAGDESGVMKEFACTEGPSKLLGTGFGIDTTDNPDGDDQNHASTDWLTTTVSVASLAGQEITLLFAVWDSSDGELDTTVLVDNVHWTFLTGANQSAPPVTGPTTLPK
jgi:hypothetical protein